jgi:hypothetical protein
MGRAETVKMQFMLHIADASGQNMAVLTLTQRDVEKSAIDLVFDSLGCAPSQLVENGVLPQGQIKDYEAIQQLLFGRDEQGLFIKDDVNMKANGSDLDPDATIIGAFRPASHDGVEYRRCDITVNGGAAGVAYNTGSGTGYSTGNGGDTISNDQTGSIIELSLLMFLHQFAAGILIDVTKELAELHDIISWAEKEGLIEIDVEKVAYKLTAKGKRLHDSYIEEAQNLIIRYDIFSDVDIDSTGGIFFDSGHGKDLRVPIYELEGIDPYRARFILGLNDGEWDNLDEWPAQCVSESWYREIFEPIDQAPSLENLQKPLMSKVLEQGKAKMRSEQT